MHHVLVAVDGSDWAQAAARYALDFARATQREVLALGVLPPDIASRMQEAPATLAFSNRIPEGEALGKRAVREWFDRAEELCQEAGVCFTRSADVGEPGERVAWAALTCHLCAFGARGTRASRSAVNASGLGKVAYYLVRNCLKPMLIAPVEYKPIRRVLLGWDDHPQCAHAAEMLLPVAQALGWEIIVLSGTQVASPMAQRCARIAEAFAEQGVSAQSFVTEGNAPAVIFEGLSRFQPDLLVIGGHRRTARGLLSEGSWLQIVQQVTIPTLLYR